MKRTFADLYGVSPDTVEVSWTSGESITVQCAGKEPQLTASTHIAL
jgi:hypothetical protein